MTEDLNTGTLGVQADGEPVASATTDPTPTTSASASETPVTPEPEEKHRLSGSARNKLKLDAERIARENAEAAERSNRERLEAAERELAALRGGSAHQSGEPNWDTWDGDHASFLQAHKEWVRSEALKEAQYQSLQTEAQRHMQQIQTTYAQRAAEYASEDREGFAQRMAVLDEIANQAAQVNPNTADALRLTIISADKGPAIADYLASNPDVAAEVAMMPPNLALLRLGEISAKIEPGKKLTKRVTQAPPPVVPLTPPSGGEPQIARERWQEYEVTNRR